jgi:hypothetical protein
MPATVAVGQSTKSPLLGESDSPMTDILERLKSWRVQLVADAPHRKGELPQIEIDLVRRAIDEIESLRSTVKALRAS